MIVLDTSYSINENLAKRFISNTYSILSTSNMFYKSCKVHIIQCDDRIRKDDVISNQNEMDQLLNSFTLVGKGNTDFRPVFSYVNDLINQKVFKIFVVCSILRMAKESILKRVRPIKRLLFI